MEATIRSLSGFRAPQACPARATVRPRVGPETWQQHSGRQLGAPAPPPRVGPLRAPASRRHRAGAPGERSPAPGRHQKPRREVAGTPQLPETSQSLTSPQALLTLRAARSREPGVCLGRGARLRIRSGSSSASAPRGARASPFGSPASLRRGAPLARAARPRPLEAPPTGGPAPRAFPLPGSRPLQAGKVLLDSDLTKLRQPRKVIILHPKSV